MLSHGTKAVTFRVGDHPLFDMPPVAAASATESQTVRPFLDMSDGDAVAEVVRGNREMFEVIVRRYNPQLYRVGMAYLRNHAQAEDAMQNAYLKAFLNLGRYQGRALFSTWLTRIMINECLMLLRRQKQCVAELLDEASSEIEQVSIAPPAFNHVYAQEMKALLEQAILTLPRTHRAVYLLREMQHLTTAETAKCLNLSRENVKVCLHRAREGLKAQLLKTAAGVELFDYAATWCDPMTAKVMQAVLRVERAG